MNKVLITGGSGQLAKAFSHLLSMQGIEYLALNHQQCDICQKEQILEHLLTFQPDALINCAAYNNVDKAEQEQEQAVAVNGEAVGMMAKLCADSQCLFVHFSTDYVFDGKKNAPYNEEDPVNPLNVYGQSKARGEDLLKSLGGDFLIFRTSWVFGEGKTNFLYKLREWSQANQILKIVDDQVSVPSFTEDIASVVILAIRQKLRGLYHLTNDGACSRFEFAKKYFEIIGEDVKVEPARSEDFSQYIQRPSYSVLSNKKIKKSLNLDIPTWDNAVYRYCQKE